MHFLPFSLIFLHQIALHQWHKTSQKEILNFCKIFYRDDVTHWINSPPFILEHLDYFQLLFIYVNIVIHHLFIFLNIIFLCLGAETKLVNSTFFFLKSAVKLLSKWRTTSYSATRKNACVHVIILLQPWIFSEYLLFWYNIKYPVSIIGLLMFYWFNYSKNADIHWLICIWTAYDYFLPFI